MAEKKKSAPPSAKKKVARRIGKALSAVGKCLLTTFLIGVITLTMVGCVMVVYVITQFHADEGVPNLDKMSATAGTVILVKNAEDAWEEHQQLQGANSIWKDIGVIPRHMQLAVIAIEDERFETHYGVDWKRTIAAMLNLVRTRVFGGGGTEFGGSTITQQLIKVTTKENDHKIDRKITEILRAVEMEKKYTKEEILEAYLNNLPLTGDIVGVGAGAQAYFAKDVQDLTIAEAAVLASITQNPSRFNPYTHPENIRSRQRVVLRKMYELGFITADEYKQAVGEELHFKSGLKPTGLMDYYTDLLVEDVIADLMDAYGYTYRYAQNMVFYGGLRIYSAEIPSQQAAVEAIFADEANFPKHLERDKDKDPQAALFVMDYNGRVVATAGGRGEKTAARVLNRSTQSTRQPGSSMKPLTAYSPAIYNNIVHYSSIVRDAPITVDGKLWPPNYGVSAKDRGTVLLNYALQQSLNTVPVRLVQEITPQKCFDFGVDRLHLSSLVKSRVINGQVYRDIDLAPLALGGLTDGVIARDMAAAYATFGSGGLYNKPYTYYEVSRGGEDTGTEKEVLLSSKPMNLRAFDEDTAYVMNRMMQQVTNSGTARDIGAAWKGWEVFGKTGTTDNNVDVYFCGGTPYYVGASWFGYDDNTKLSSGQVAYAKRLWNLSMKALHNGLSLKGFEKKGNTQELSYCTATGLIAAPGCPKKATGVYKKDNIPAVCGQHGGGTAGTASPSSGT